MPKTYSTSDITTIKNRIVKRTEDSLAEFCPDPPKIGPVIDVLVWHIVEAVVAEFDEL